MSVSVGLWNDISLDIVISISGKRLAIGDRTYESSVFCLQRDHEEDEMLSGASDDDAVAGQSTVGGEGQQVKHLNGGQEEEKVRNNK